MVKDLWYEYLRFYALLQNISSRSMELRLYNVSLIPSMFYSYKCKLYIVFVMETKLK